MWFLYKEVLALFDMKGELTQCLMPAQCSQCGQIFDLQHDSASFGALESGDGEAEVGVLCWVCRDR